MCFLFAHLALPRKVTNHSGALLQSFVRFASVATKKRISLMAKKPSADKKQQEAKKILERVQQESETVGASSMRRTAEHITSHIKADDADENEWAELWGKRIGRTLSVIFFIVLVIYLVRTYVLHA